MWSLQPKVAKVEEWSHPGGISLSFPFTAESDFSSLGFQRRKVSSRGRKGLGDNNWSRVSWSSAGGWFSWGNFLQAAILRLPASVALLLCYSTQLPAKNCPSWQKMFCSGWFLWVEACKQSGCSCSQWCYKLPASNPLSMVVTMCVPWLLIQIYVVHQTTPKSRTLQSLQNWVTNCVCFVEYAQRGS